MKIQSRPLSIIFLIIGVGFFCIQSCKPKSSLEEMETWSQQLDSFSVEKAQNVKIRYSDSGRLKAIITAPLMEHYGKDKDPYTEMKEGVKAQFYDIDGREESNLKADYAINYEKKKLIHLKNNVHVVNTKGEELISEDLWWDQNKAQIRTDKQVTIKRGEENIIGLGLVSNETFTKYRIEKPIGKLNLPEQKDTTE